MNAKAESFAPIVGNHAHTLLLGTMPGQASLSEAEYYAHPRNAFWPIMMAIINKQPPAFETSLLIDYQTRCQILIDHGYAVWDVLASCVRPGSLDSNIVKSSELPNDIASLSLQHRELKLIVCNGRAAESLFKRHIIKTLNRPVQLASKPVHEAQTNAIRLTCLPSTSPAMASLTLTDKHQVWADGLLG